MENQVRCPHHPWATEVWLLLAVICNANGSILFFNTLIPSPYSYFATAFCILLYRKFLDIEPDMPIFIDLAISFLCLLLVELKSWEIAIAVVFSLNWVAYVLCYAIDLGPEYSRLRERNPDGQVSLGILIRPLSQKLWYSATSALYFFQTVFMFLVCFFPFGEEYYWYYQMILGCYLVGESFVFLRCFRQITAAIAREQRRR